MLTPNMVKYLHNSRWLLLAMLWLLHGALLLGVKSPWIHPLLLTHFGLFLLWQPLWRSERKVGISAFILIALATVAELFFLSWWTVAFWLTGLFGLVGARVFVFREHWARLLYMMVMIYLLAVLLLWVVPNLFAAQATIEVGRTLIRYVLPFLLLAMMVLPASKELSESARTVDFIYSLLLFMLLALVVLGSLAFMTLGKLDYLDALLRALFLIGFILLAFGVLWNPRFGFSGLQAMFSRYLLNVGTPFESWLTELTEAVQREPDAASYMHRAVSLLSDLPWLSGLSWQSSDGDGEVGQVSEHAAVVEERGLSLTLYAKQSLNPTLMLHIHLLVQLIGYFYQSKQREQTLRDITRLQAVYETGSRLTHDLKNMLQSLLSLTAISQNRELRSQQLLQQQLPLLSQRIEATLVKLQQPHLDNESALLALNAWWGSLRLRNRFQDIHWREPDVLPDRNIPVAMFDCVIDNLIDNALRKRQTEPNIDISVEIRPEPLSITVCDSGDAIPDRIAGKLLRGVIVSENGFGIGLYQASRWAEQLDYQLVLISNHAGNVCFELLDNSASAKDKRKMERRRVEDRRKVERRKESDF
ncbi:MAG: ATP-binding protein [Gallionella sp.]